MMDDTEEQQRQLYAALMGGAGVPRQRDLLSEQLQQAYALMGRPTPPHTTGWGAALGGLGNVIANLMGARQARDLRGELGQLDQREATSLRAGNQLYAQAPQVDVISLEALPDDAQIDVAAQNKTIQAMRQTAQQLAVSPQLADRAKALNERADSAEKALAHLFESRKTRAAKADRPAPEMSVRAGDDGSLWYLDPRNPAAKAQPVLGPDGRQLKQQPPLGAPATYITGEGGIYSVDPRRPSAPAQPVVDATGKQVAKPKEVRPLQQGDREALEALAEQQRNFEDLSSTFKDEYAGGGPVGAAKIAVGGMAGNLASPKLQEATAWWAKFKKLVDLPERNKTFGSSLSNSEKQSWESAKNIKEGADPTLIRKTFAELQGIVSRKSANRRDSLIADGYRPEAIDALLGAPPTQQQVERTPTGSFDLADDDPAKYLPPEKQRRLLELRGGK